MNAIVGKETNTCENCKHFILHYVPYGKGFIPISRGHCTMPRVKSRESHFPACPNWTAQNKKLPAK